MKENSELFSRNRRYVLDTRTKGSQLSQWGSRARMESWGQARVGTTTTKEGPEGHGLGGSIGNVHSRESFLSTPGGELHHGVTIINTEECKVYSW